MIGRKWIEWHLHRAKQQWEAQQYISAQWHLDQAERIRMLQQHPIWLIGPIQQTYPPEATTLLAGLLVAEQLGYVRWDAHNDDWKVLNEHSRQAAPPTYPDNTGTEDRRHIRTEYLPVANIDEQRNRRQTRPNL